MQFHIKIKGKACQKDQVYVIYTNSLLINLFKLFKIKVGIS